MGNIIVEEIQKNVKILVPKKNISKLFKNKD